MKEVLISGAVRTPIGGLGGALSKLSAVELGKAVAKESLARSGVQPENVDEVIIGNVLQAGLGQNPARQIAMDCGVPVAVPSFTVNQVCGSGMKAIDLALRSILLGEATVVVAGGIESMSGAPYILPALRQGAGFGRSVALDLVESDGLTDVFGQYHMGITAENIAEKCAISREDQDRFAAESQRRCGVAIENGVFADEIVPITIKQRKKEIIVDRDEHPRPDSTFEILAKLRPAFKPDGTVTAGNASGINDGAASLIVADAVQIADKSQCVRIRDIVCVGCAPELMGLGPVGAVNKLLQRQGMNTNDIDLWELNEAFAVQALAVLEQLKLDPAKVNVNGGAIALGHPIGASGARIVVTLIHQMKRQNAAFGVASLCVGGGMGLAILLENI
jgi:acetyl-CoA C-acetyltransferase